MARETTSKVPAKATKTAKQPDNTNLELFVDALTPIPGKPITDNFIQVSQLMAWQKSASVTEKELIQSMIDIVLSCNKQPQFFSYGEKIAVNTLKSLKILV
jgi:hypothetical protein